MGRGIAVSALLHGLLVAGLLFGIPDFLLSDLFTQGVLAVALVVLLAVAAWVLLSSPGFIAAVGLAVLVVLGTAVLADEMLRSDHAQPLEAKALDVDVVTADALEPDIRRAVARIADRLHAKDADRPASRSSVSALPKKAATPSKTPTKARTPPRKEASKSEDSAKQDGAKARKDTPAPVPPELKRPEPVLSVAGKTKAKTPAPKTPPEDVTPHLSVQFRASPVNGDHERRKATQRRAAALSQPPALRASPARRPAAAPAVAVVTAPAPPRQGARPPASADSATAPAARSEADAGVGAVFAKLAETMPRLSALRRVLADDRPPAHATPFPPSATDARIAELAAEGFPHAQFALAERLIAEGARGERLARAVALLRGAALSGHAPAQLALAMIKAQGFGGEPDVAAAAAWLEIAGRNGVAGAARARETLVGMMTASERVRARVRASSLARLVSMMTPQPVEGRGSVSDRLHLAAVLGDIEQVHSLLAQDADPDKADKYGRTPLIESAWRGYVGIARALLRGGASLEARDATGKDALQWAAINGHERMVSVLLAAGADVNARDGEGFTALMRAAWNGHRDVVAALLSAGARVDIRNRHNLTALDYARKERYRTIERLLEG